MSVDSIVTLTTDFGASSPYVAAMKGVILSINPQVQVIDITHAIPPQQIRPAAQVLADTTWLFPPRTIHLAVVDPGVGTSRAIVYAEIANQQYICPDNGLLDRLAELHCPTKIIQVRESKYFRSRVTPTFHGRDIMAPVVGHLSLGLAPELLGPPHATLVRLNWQKAEKMANRIEGEVIEVDSFGNLITNITRDMLNDVPTDETVAIRCEEHETRSIFQTYGDQPAMTLVALIGSNDKLEIAIVDDSATIMLGVGVGAPVEVSW